MDSKIHTLDVREDFRSGRSPFDKVQSALSKVAPGESLRLLVPFEPMPLFQIAAGKGLGHTSKQTSEGHWEVLFSHVGMNLSQPGPRTSSDGTGCGCHETGTTEIEEVDARGLEPPQPGPDRHALRRPADALGASHPKLVSLVGWDTEGHGTVSCQLSALDKNRSKVLSRNDAVES